MLLKHTSDEMKREHKSTTIRNSAGADGLTMGEKRWNDSGILARKTKRPGLSLSPGASVDQPSPKCCSRTTLCLPPPTVNGSVVLSAGTNDPCGAAFRAQNKTPQTQFESWASVDQPSPKCCSRTTLPLTPKTVNGSPVLGVARRCRSAKSMRKKTLQSGCGGAQSL